MSALLGLDLLIISKPSKPIIYDIIIQNTVEIRAVKNNRIALKFTEALPVKMLLIKMS